MVRGMAAPPKSVTAAVSARSLKLMIPALMRSEKATAPAGFRAEEKR
jgi:hypothetical protein